MSEPMTITPGEVLAGINDLRARYRVSLAQWTAWETGTVTGGAMSPDGTGTGGPYYPLTDLDGATVWVACLAYYLQHGGLRIMGTVASVAALPTTGRVQGDLYIVTATTPYHAYVYVGGVWIDAGAFQGPTGIQGPQGVSVTSGAIDANFHLILTLSGGQTLDVGYVRGGQGPTGSAGVNGTNGTNGANGVGIASAAITGGHLILTLTTGGTIDAGQVQGATGSTGATGVSVTNVAVNASGRLIATLSSGATIDAGYVVGPQGASGNGSGNLVGPASSTVGRVPVWSANGQLADGRDVGAGSATSLIDRASGDARYQPSGLTPLVAALVFGA